MPLVFRVAHSKNDGGPYSNGDCYNLDQSLFDKQNHPCPSDFWDRKDAIDNYHFGFKSRTQLKKWFNPTSRTVLNDKGYKVFVYFVPKKYVVKIPKQVAFIRKRGFIITTSRL